MCRRLYVPEAARYRAVVMLGAMLADAATCPGLLADSVRRSAVACAGKVNEFVVQAVLAGLAGPDGLESVTWVEPVCRAVARLPPQVADETTVADAFAVLARSDSPAALRFGAVSLLAAVLPRTALDPDSTSRVALLATQVMCKPATLPPAVAFGALMGAFSLAVWSAVATLLPVVRDAAAAAALVPSCIHAVRAVAGSRAQTALAALALLLDAAGELAEEMVCEAIDAAWDAVQEAWRETNTRFWWVVMVLLVRDWLSCAVRLTCRPLLARATAVMLHQTVVSAAVRSAAVASRVRQVFADVLAAGDAKLSLLPCVYAACARLWCNPAAGAVASLSLFIPELVRGCLVGSVADRHDRLAARTAAAIAEQYMGTTVAALWTVGTMRDIVDVRVARWHAVSVLLSLSPCVSEHAALATAVTAELLRRNAALDASGKSFHANTTHHREKVRIWQCLVALTAFATETTAPGLLDRVLAALVHDNQPSVRYYAEWVAARCVCAAPTLVERLLVTLQQAECRPCVVVSILTILVLSTPRLVAKQAVSHAAHLRSVYAVVLPWLASTHATVRLYAAGLLRRLYDSDALAVLAAAGMVADQDVLRACLHYFAVRVDAKKHVERLLEDFFFGRFNVDADWTAEVECKLLSVWVCLGPYPLELTRSLSSVRRRDCLACSSKMSCQSLFCKKQR